MTGQDIEKRVRAFSGDTETPQTYSPEHLVWFINDGVALIIGRRPDAKIVTAGSAATITELTDITGTISIANRWRGCLAEYVASCLFQMDATDRKDFARAEAHMKRCLMLLAA